MSGLQRLSRLKEHNTTSRDFQPLGITNNSFKNTTGDMSFNNNQVNRHNSADLLRKPLQQNSFNNDPKNFGFSNSGSFLSSDIHFNESKNFSPKTSNSYLTRNGTPAGTLGYNGPAVGIEERMYADPYVKRTLWHENFKLNEKVF
jgi:hypothetical protein